MAAGMPLPFAATGHPGYVVGQYAPGRYGNGELEDQHQQQRQPTVSQVG
jgi:hypothetical protein